jgi:hypothetical protein
MKKDNITAEETNRLLLLLQALKSTKIELKEKPDLYRVRLNWLKFLRKTVDNTEFFDPNEPKGIRTVGVNYVEILTAIAKGVHKICFPHINEFLKKLDQSLLFTLEGISKNNIILKYYI